MLLPIFTSIVAFKERSSSSDWCYIAAFQEFIELGGCA